jgi:hypothetical protein
MNNGQGYHEDNWGGGHMNYQRGANQNINRFGYGANQQRWNSGNNVGRGGYQNRFRANSHGGVALMPIFYSKQCKRWWRQ